MGRRHVGRSKVRRGWLEVALLFSVLHGRLAGFVVRARAPLGDSSGGNLRKDIVDGIRRTLDHSGTDYIADGADSHHEVRAIAAGVLSRLGPRAVKALPALRSRSVDEAPDVREAAEYAVRQIAERTRPPPSPE